MNIVRLSTSRHEHPEIEAEAQAWVVRLDGGFMSRAEKAELGEWLSRSPVHKRLFQEAARFWFDLDGLSALVFEVEKAHARGRARPRRALGGFAAAAALLLALAIGLAWRFLPAPQDAPVQYATAVGEIREIELADGSTLSLNTDTRVAVAFRKRARLVHLLRGEAVFEVAHERERPFLVYVGRHAVKAVGTVFSVLEQEHSVDVRVIEGRIEVSSFGAPLGESADLEAALGRKADSRVPLDVGQRGIFGEEAGKRERVEAIGAASLENDLSWRDGMLVFDDDSLESVVAEINRYTPTRIVIADAGIRGLRFGGHFRVGDIGAILATLEQDYGIRVDRASGDQIYLSRDG